MPPRPSEELGPEDWQEPMYFKSPSQLLDVFTQLEEQNLFLIQNAQETEEQLEELRMKFKDTKERMDDETAALQQQIEELQVNIDAQRDHVAALLNKAQLNSNAFQGSATIPLETLHEKASGRGIPPPAGPVLPVPGAAMAVGWVVRDGHGGGMGSEGEGWEEGCAVVAGERVVGGGTLGTQRGRWRGSVLELPEVVPAVVAVVEWRLQERLVREMRAPSPVLQVKDVFETCLGEKDGTQKTIPMLQAIEVRMEHYLAEIADIPTDFLVEAEKAREKERRQRARERKMTEQANKQKEKAEKAIARAYKPVPKKKEKPVMFRSVLPKKKVSSGPGPQACRRGRRAPPIA